MITISRYLNGVTVLGHAGYAPKGADIICASVSALTLCLIESINELTVNSIKTIVEDGKAIIRFTNDLTDTSEILVESFFIGVEQIADEYPAYVKVEKINGFMHKAMTKP